MPKNNILRFEIQWHQRKVNSQTYSYPKITAATITTLSYLNTELPEDPRDITPEQWEAMKAVDIRSVDPSELVDLSTVQIDSSLPVRERSELSQAGEEPVLRPSWWVRGEDQLQREWPFF